MPRISRRTRRFLRRGRRAFRRRKYSLVGRRFSRIRRGRRSYGRFRRSRRLGVRRRMSRLRRASRSTRSSGNVGEDYQRVNRRIEGYNTQQFPTLNTGSPSRFTVAWSLLGDPVGTLVSGTPGGFGPITGPSALAPGNGQVPLKYCLSGYYSVCIADLHEFAGDTFQQFREYRIRKVTYTFTPRAGMYTTSPGGGDFSAGPEGTEVMIVNTSKVGQFVVPAPLAHVGAVTHEDSPWYQALNYPSHRNIAKVVRLNTRRPRTIKLTVDPTEDYIVNEVQDVQGSFGNNAFSSDPNPYEPVDRAIIYQSGTNASTLAVKRQAARFQVKRRRFRWTKQWLIWRSSATGDTPNILYVRNDVKFAHGCQFLVKPYTYWQSTVPYFNVSINVSYEFRGRLMQRLTASTSNTGAVLFPWTNATFSTSY